ncbi:NAD(P)/FAD-dependent oxidoreductase [Anaerococcus sp. Marseille-P9784]|uniref:NAD(P)/FAD-dependent oxidoreductase n=1 Tax=Anaerococcus sp. Marseille-P9784 TaxID=2614127 RepID=UPI00124AB037|nr:FAD-dependent oxidoreductase [Anaerococcus sp. Marseille-P9784]
MYDYLIIGNGIAGLAAAEEIRKNDENGKILIVSKEEIPTYWRTRLSALIAKDFDKDDIYVKKEAWYQEKNIEEKLDTEVEKLDLENNKAILADGEEIEYAKVLLATGARAFVPPIKNVESKGVFAIRSLDDLISFKEYAADKKEVVIIGGGILGLEAAFSVKELGKEVSVIEAADYILNRQLDHELSKKLEKSLNDMGIKTFTGKATEEILVNDGKVSGIKLSNGEEIKADVIMVQAGVRSIIDLAKNSNLEVDRGIIVNDNLQSKKENVYAAGDCAQIGNFTIGLWTASQEMGKIVGRNMTGAKETYEKPKPFSTLMIGNIKVFSAGMTSGEGIEEMKTEKDGNIYKLFKKDGKFVGGILWNDIKMQNDVKDLVFNGKNLEDTKLAEIFN